MKDHYKLKLVGIDGTTFAVGDTEQELIDQYNDNAAGGDIPCLTIDDIDGLEWTVDEGCWNELGGYY